MCNVILLKKQKIQTTIWRKIAPFGNSVRV